MIACIHDRYCYMHYYNSKCGLRTYTDRTVWKQLAVINKTQKGTCLQLRLTFVVPLKSDSDHLHWPMSSGHCFSLWSWQRQTPKSPTPKCQFLSSLPRLNLYRESQI